MSFPKAKNKRFNEIASCAPPPGRYNPKSNDRVQGAYIDAKGDRFKEDKVKAMMPGPASDVSLSMSLSSFTPKKALFSSTPSLASTQDTNTGPSVKLGKKTSQEVSRIRELETELRQILSEKRELDKRLEQRESNLTKIDGRLQHTIREKSSLQASVASLEKQLADLTRANQLLKTKAAVADEASELKKNHAKLEAAKSEMEQKNQVLVADVKEKQKQCVTMAIETRREVECGVVERVDSILNRVQGMEGCDSSQDALVQYKDELEQEMSRLKEMIRTMSQDKQDSEELIRHLKGEVFAARDEVQQERECVETNQRRIEELEVHLEQLSQSEEVLQENIKRISMKYDTVEQDFAAYEKTISDQVNQLTRELATTRTALTTLNDDHHKLQKTNLSLVQALNLNQGNQNHYEEQMGEANKDIAILTIELSLVQSSLKATEEDLINHKQLLAKVEQEKEDEERELHSVRQHLWETEHARSQLERRLSGVTCDLEAARESHRKQVEEVEKQHESDEVRSQLVLAEVRSQVEMMTETQQRTSDEVRSLQHELEAVLGEKCDVEGAYKKACERLCEEQSVREALQREMEEAWQEFEVLRREEGVLLERYCACQRQVTNLQASRSEVEGQVEVLQREISCLREEQGDLEVTVQQQCCDLEGFREKEALLHGQLTDSKQHIEQFEKDCVENNRQLQECHVQIGSMESTIENLRHEECLSKKTCDEMRQLLEGQRDDIDTMEKRVYDLTQQLYEKQADVHSFSVQITALEGGIQERDEQMEMMASQRDKVLTELDAKTHALELTERKLEQAVEESSSMSQALQTLNTKFTSLNANVQQRDWTIAELSEEKGHIKTNLTRVENQLSEISVRLEESEVQTEALEGQLLSLEDCVSGQNEVIAEVRQERDSIQTELQNADVHLNEVTVRLEESEAQTEALEGQVVSLEAGIRAREEELEEAKQQRAKLLEDVNETTEEWVNLQYVHNQLLVDIKANTSQQVLVKKELSSVKAQLGQANAKIVRLEKCLCVATEALQEQNSMWESQLDLWQQREEVVMKKYSLSVEETHRQEQGRLLANIRELEQNVADLQNHSRMTETAVQEEKVTQQSVIDRQAAQLEEMQRTLKRREIELEAELHQLKQDYHQRLVVTEQRQKEADQSEAVAKLRLECNRWKKAFEELSIKAEPFKEQIEAYQLERSSILRRSKDTQKELQELAQKYASLLGHQNTKQKIKHVEKLKTENLQLKDELSKLREIDGKRKREVARLQEKLDCSEGKKRFDTSKSFQLAKENQVPRSPLGNGNR